MLTDRSSMLVDMVCIIKIKKCISAPLLINHSSIFKSMNADLVMQWPGFE